MARKRRGFGRLRQLPSGRWQAAYIGPDTKLHQAPRTYANESDAEGWLAGERRKIDLGTWGAVERSDGITLRAYADEWIEQRRTAAPHPPALRVDAGAAHPARPGRREDRHADTGQGPPVARRAGRRSPDPQRPRLRAAARDLRDGRPRRSARRQPVPYPGGDADQSETRRRRATPAEVDRLAAKMPARLRASVVLAAWCGLRWGETSELRRKDVSKDAPPYASAARSPTAAASSTSGSRRPRRSARRRDTAAYPPDPQSALEEPRRAAPPTRCCSAATTAATCATTTTAPIGRRPAPRSANRTCGFTTCATSALCSPPNPAPPQPNSCTDSGTPRRRWRSVSARRRRPRRRDRRTAIETRCRTKVNDQRRRRRTTS